VGKSSQCLGLGTWARNLARRNWAGKRVSQY
jgi:hypothetical protein